MFWKKYKPLSIIAMICLGSVTSITLHAKIILRSGFEYKEQQYGYDFCGEPVPLGEVIFDGAPLLEDIYLPSRLSRLGYITLALPPGAPFFGLKPDEQYLSALATTHLLWDASVQEHRFWAEGGCYMRTNMSWGPRLWYIGLLLPCIKKRQSLNLDIVNNSIVPRAGYPAYGENTAKQFLTDAGIDFLDFFTRYVLNPKGMIYILNNEVIRIGDLQILGMVDWGGVFDGIETLQCMFSIGFPLETRQSADIVWPNHVSEGAYSFKLQGTMQIQTGRSFYNPFVKVSLTGYLPFREERRVKEKVTSLLSGELPSRYSLNLIESFEDYNSLTHLFAGRKQMLSIYEGVKLFGLLGNLFYLSDNRLRIGVLYEGSIKGETWYRTSNMLSEKRIYLPYRSSHKVLFHASYAPSDQFQCSFNVSQQIGGIMTGREFSCMCNIVYKI